MKEELPIEERIKDLAMQKALAVYKEHPEELIGKTITVQYFEETTDKSGNISLRFPTCKMVYENGRDL